MAATKRKRTARKSTKRAKPRRSNGASASEFKRLRELMAEAIAAPPMAAAPSTTQPPGTSPSNLKLHKGPTETDAQGIAHAVLTPPVRAAVAVADWAHGFGGGGALDVNTLNNDLLDHTKRLVVDGKNLHAEAMLLNQAVALESMFYALAERGAGNLRAGYLDASERLLRLAFRAQAQSAATLERLALVKNPKQIAFVRANQANLAGGHQQINNGTSRKASRARKVVRSGPDKVLTEQPHATLDTAGAPATVEADSTQKAMAALNRTTDSGG